MPLKLLFFGQLTDIVDTASMQMDYIKDTNTLISIIHDRYPKLQELNYRIAVDKTIIIENTLLNESSTVAFMPPFSGG